MARFGRSFPVPRIRTRKLAYLIPRYLHGGSNTGNSPLSINASAVAAGNLIVVGLTCFKVGGALNSVTSITDNAGNAYIRAVSKARINGDHEVEIWYAYNLGASAGLNLTVTAPGATIGASIQVWENVGFLANPLDNRASNNGNSTSLSTGSYTPLLHINEAAFAVFGSDAGETYTAGAGYSNMLQSSGNSVSVGMESAVLSSTASGSATATMTSASDYAAAIVTFLPIDGKFSAKSKAQSSVSRVSAGVTKAQSSVSRMSSPVSITQTSHSYILQSPFKFQLSKSRISTVGGRRVNLTTNPNFDADTAGNGHYPALWTHVAHSGSLSYSGVANDFSSTGPNSVKIAASTAAIEEYYQNLTGFSAGQTVTFSARFKTDANVTNVGLVIYDNGATTETHIGASQNGRFSVTRTLTGSGTISFSIGLGTYSGGASLGTVWFDDVMVEVSPTNNPYFDGNSVGASWTGATDSSTSVMTGYNQPSVSRIQTLPTSTLSSVSRITEVVTSTLSSVSRIRNSVTKTQVSHSYILAAPFKTQLSVSRIQASPTSNLISVSRLLLPPTSSIASVSRITETVNSALTSTSNIIAVQSTISSVSRIQATVTKTQSSVSRIQATVTKAQSSVSRITETITKTQPSVSRITETVAKTQASKSRIVTTVAKTQLSVSRISELIPKTLTSVSRIRATVTGVLNGKSRISHGESTSISSVSKIFPAPAPLKWTAILPVGNVTVQLQSSLDPTVVLPSGNVTVILQSGPD